MWKSSSWFTSYSIAYDVLFSYFPWTIEWNETCWSLFFYTCFQNTIAIHFQIQHNFLIIICVHVIHNDNTENVKNKKINYSSHDSMDTTPLTEKKNPISIAQKSRTWVHIPLQLMIELLAKNFVSSMPRPISFSRYIHIARLTHSNNGS